MYCTMGSKTQMQRNENLVCLFEIRNAHFSSLLYCVHLNYNELDTKSFISKHPLYGYIYFE